MELVSIGKSFPGVRALHEVSITFEPGEVHALVGANGAGKSTLIQIMSGVYAADCGQVRWQGAPVTFRSSEDAAHLGIVAVYQEADLFGSLSIAENVAIASGLNWGLAMPPPTFVNWRAIHERARRIVQVAGVAVDIRQAGATLSVAQRQLIQIRSAVERGARFLILDEPTSSLSGAECEWLFGQIRQLRQSGATIVYISHRQPEVLSLADRITVLREGQVVWSGPRSETSSEQLVAQMIGRDACDPRSPESHRQAEPNVNGRQGKGHQVPTLRLEGVSDCLGRFERIELDVCAGEVVGLYGLVGAGRSEIAQAVFGLRAFRGIIRRDGKTVHIQSPRDAVRQGIAYVPEDRLQQGAFGELSILTNSVISSLSRWCLGPFVSRLSERRAAQAIIDEYDVRHQHLEQRFGQLSGGNQQKVILGRWTKTSPQVLLLDEPTRGIDVGTKIDVYRAIRNWAKSGKAILLISSDPDEVWENSDRVLVVCEGKIKRQFDTKCDRQDAMAAAAFPDHSEQRTAEIKTSSSGSSFRDNANPRRTWLPSGPGKIAIALGLCWLLTGGGDLRSWGTAASMWIVLALSASLPIIVGGIDISIGAIVALSAAIAAATMRVLGSDAFAIPAALVSSTLAGAFCGALNAVVSLLGRIHPIVVTLGTMTIWRGIVIAMLGGRAVTGVPSVFTQGLGRPMYGSLWMTALIVAILWLWLERSVSGRKLFAVGSNPTAAARYGISRTTAWILAYAVAGGLAGVCGAMQLGYSGQMQAQLGAGWELTAISAAVIGGVAITGGRGRVLGIVAGAISLRFINSLLVRWGIAEDRFELVAGLLLLVAILSDRFWNRTELQRT